MRRAGAAWLPEEREQSILLHAFPFDGHHYHVGETHRDNDPDRTGIVVPDRDGPSGDDRPWSLGWQLRLSLAPTGKTLFDYIDALGGTGYGSMGSESESDPGDGGE
jgi:hypothetical protein